MPRLIFLNRFFYPDHSATSQLLTDVAFALAADGRDVHVVTSSQLYDRPQARLGAEQTIDNVHVTRVGTTEFGRMSLPGRAADYAVAHVAMARAALKLTRPGDIVVAKTDPPLLSIVGRHVAQRRGAKLINWLQDIYPDVAAATGLPFMNGIAAKGLKALRNRSLRHASANVVLGTAMAERLRDIGVPDDRIAIMPNWTDDEAIVPLAATVNPLRKTWQLDGKFIVGYSGNLGRAHDVKAILAAAEALRDRPDIVFVFIGGGSLFETARQRAEANKLGATMRFFPYQPRETLPLSLTLPDLHWLSFRPAMEGLIFPSKLYGIAAAGRPLLALAAPDGELGRLIARHHCGVSVEPGDHAGVIRTIVSLAANTAIRETMGRNARAMLDAEFTHRKALERWRKLIARVEG